MLLALSLSLYSCGGVGGALNDMYGDDGVAKTLVITGIRGYSGDVVVSITSTTSPNSMVAFGKAAISGNKVTVPLVDAKREGTQWTGKGRYYIILGFDKSTAIYFHSGGGTAPLKYNISDATTTIALDKFQRRK